ncbi:protein ALP1-like [Glycine soja]|uniref:Protein ALP1-like n=1 Tax=Glycine soja TaxID=3848 RepID=A0A445G2C3_GLYSO|nr:protein ALP1-like [Glycine soja]RZB55350.1 Protein ALP1-like [Glycine soja]
MEIGSPAFLTLEDYSSFFFPDMDPIPNSNVNKRRANNDQFDLNDSAFSHLLNSIMDPNHFQHQSKPIQFDSSPTKRARRDLLVLEDSHLNPASAPQQQRRLWVKDRSKDWWQRCNSPDFPEEEFRRHFRMSKATFDMICQHLDSAVTKKNTMLREAIPVRQRVAVCIWRLATGDPLREVSKRFGLGISTCHKLVLEVCSAIKSVLMPKFLHWPNEAEMKPITEKFESLSGIPNVGGSMYTTHIPIIAPKSNVNAYFNKRHTERNQKTCYSITVQGVVDPKGIFSDVCIGWPGSLSDDQVLEKSALYQRATMGNLKDVWVVGNSGHPLMEGVLVPYTHQNLTWTQHAFNQKVGEIQSIAKDAFARLKGRWSCLQKRTEVKLEDLPVLLGACCVLHNICEMRDEEMKPQWNFDIFDDQMLPQNNNLRSNAAEQARDQIAHYLLHHGRAGTNFF